MDPSSDRETQRLRIGFALTQRAQSSLGGRVMAGSPEQLLSLAQRLAPGMDAIEYTYRFHCHPPYPGLTAGPEAVGDRYRIVLACAATDARGEPIGLIFTSLIIGRLPLVSVAPPETPIPPHWRPVLPEEKS